MKTAEQVAQPASPWHAVCWSPLLSLFCAVPHRGTGMRLMTSPDGIKWTLWTSAADNKGEDR